MLACGLCSHAVTIDMSEAPDNLTEELIYYSDFDTGEADVNEIYIHLPCHAQSGTARMGTAEGYGEYWRDDIKGNGNCQSKSYTLSFDLHELKGRDGACMLSMYTDGQNREKGLYLQMGKKDTLYLVCDSFCNSVTQGSRARINLGKIPDLLVETSTITVVIDGERNEIRAYVDGEPLKRRIKLKYQGNTPRKQLCVMQFCGFYGGGCGVSRCSIDNMCIWKCALTDEQVSQLTRGCNSFVINCILLATSGFMVVFLLVGIGYVLGRRSVRREQAS